MSLSVLRRCRWYNVGKWTRVCGIIAYGTKHRSRVLCSFYNLRTSDQVGDVELIAVLEIVSPRGEYSFVSYKQRPRNRRRIVEEDSLRSQEAEAVQGRFLLIKRFSGIIFTRISLRDYARIPRITGFIYRSGQ